MRIVVLVLLGALILYSVVNPLLQRTKPSFVWVGILLFVFGAIGYGELRWQLNEAAGTAIVKDISANPEGTLHCARLSEAFFNPSVTKKGHVSSAEPNVAHATYETCQRFFDWLGSDKKHATSEQVQGLHVILHEGVHVSGQYDEGITECIAMREMPRIAEKFGASAEEALRMAAVYRQEWHVRTPAQYQNATC